ncbi:MAG: 30S ribosomal protein S3 [Gemmatales bacterium]|nr:30S ribosomal protein S3 [Gemmatales bacterium]MCS7160676.1 30S ribosomal protein S3 [Gemmatales bacterium]MDW8175877.1 30S ribosomal protein S3 [Gemmatales bacterium]MDW8223241.1 30S ribosomal protein S3 [Gemmatales bacterium]
MGQKVSPVGFRIGIMEDWRSRWYAGKRDFAELLVEDEKIRQFIKKNYAETGIARIEIERTPEEVKVIVHAARAGLLIGKRGQEVEELTRKLEDLTGRKTNLRIFEVQKPELSAQLVAENIAEQLVKRASFRRAMKRAADQTMEAGAKGIKIQLSGRLAGAEMARCEKEIRGRIPLQTLRAKIDYGFAIARTTLGVIGVKVWINLGDYLEEASHAPDAQTGEVSKKPARPRPRKSLPRE